MGAPLNFCLRPTGQFFASLGYIFGVYSDKKNIEFLSEYYLRQFLTQSDIFFAGPHAKKHRRTR